MKASVRIVGRAELGVCPAAVVIDEDGSTVFVTNRDTFPKFTRQQQMFILAHELGHRLTGSADEQVADAFALGLTAGRQRRSLKSAISAVASMRAVPASRVEALYKLCLRIDRKHTNRTI